MKENGILKNLRETYLLAAADLELFPEGSEEYRRAEVEAMNTSRTVFELFGATAAEDLRAAGLEKRRQVAERMRRGHAATNFEKITESPEALAAFLSSLPLLAGPWDEDFHRYPELWKELEELQQTSRLKFTPRYTVGELAQKFSREGFQMMLGGEGASP